VVAALTFVGKDAVMDVGKPAGARGPKLADAVKSGDCRIATRLATDIG
jgi:hypothetical protein